MDRERLLQSPLPIDRMAARVTRKAAPENIWQPKVKNAQGKAFSSTVLPTAPLPLKAPQSIRNVVGKRRDKMTVIGYAAEQNPSKNARWVVRCNCGNYEHRGRILRWLGTDAPDMCVECRLRTYKKQGEWADTEPAKRATVATA